MARLIPVSCAELKAAIFLFPSFSVLFEASWVKKRHEKRSLLASSCYFNRAENIFYHEVADNDEGSIDFVVDCLILSTLPALVTFQKGNVERIIYDFKELTSANALPVFPSTFTIAKESVQNIESKEEVHSSESTEEKKLSHVMSTFERFNVTIGEVFVAGDKSSVGKSTVCLCILAALVNQGGLPPSSLSYIKPVTQCEAEQPVTRFCKRVGISQMSIGPVVFYKGFTRAYLAGETDDSSVLLQKAVNAVKSIGDGKMLTLIDGVGYPSVGSICNISNADVARALSAPVLLIGKSGVGDAVDSYNLNAAYFESFGVRVLGGIFNKFPSTGFYSLDSCRTVIQSYFTQYRPLQRPYGFLPEIEIDLSPRIISSSAEELSLSIDKSANGASSMNKSKDEVSGAVLIYPDEEKLVSTLIQNVQVSQLLVDIWMHKLISSSWSLSGYALSHPTDMERHVVSHVIHGFDKYINEGSILHPFHSLRNFQSCSKSGFVPMPLEQNRSLSHPVFEGGYSIDRKSYPERAYNVSLTPSSSSLSGIQQRKIRTTSSTIMQDNNAPISVSEVSYGPIFNPKEFSIEDGGSRMKRSREEIEIEARKNGAKSGG